MNMDDIFSQFGDIFGGGFGDAFGGGGSRGPRRTKGSNLRIKVQLTLEEIAEGVTKKVKVFRLVQAEGVEYDTCNTCGGTGQVRRVTNTILGQMQTASTCPSCGGLGKGVKSKPKDADEHGLRREESIVDIEIPLGSRTACSSTFAEKATRLLPAAFLVTCMCKSGSSITISLPAMGATCTSTTTSPSLKRRWGECGNPLAQWKGQNQGRGGNPRGQDCPAQGQGHAFCGQLWTRRSVGEPQRVDATRIDSSEERSTLESWREAPNFQPAPDPQRKRIL